MRRFKVALSLIPHAVPAEVVDAIVVARRRHPRWAPRKLLVVLRRQQPGRAWPVASTVGDILRKHGLVRRRRRGRRCSVPYGARLADYAAPNAIWCADFKGHFPVGDARCHPLTIMDGFSRYLLRCQALPRPLGAPVQRGFEATFREFGLPQAIRTAVLHAGRRRLIPVGRVVDSPRHPPGTDPAGAPRSERAQRTDAQHAEGRDRGAAAEQPARAATLLEAFRQELDGQTPYERLVAQTRLECHRRLKTLHAPKRHVWEPRVFENNLLRRM